MNRVKTFDATGVAPNGRLFAGDLNAIQDAAAALTDLTQNLSVGTLAIGESGLTLSRYGAGEAYISGMLRLGGDFRVPRMFVLPALSTDVAWQISVGSEVQPRLYARGDGALLFGAGGATAPDAILYHGGVGVLQSDGNFNLNGITSYFGAENQSSGGNYWLRSKRAADSTHRWAVSEGGQIEWGSGAGARDVVAYRDTEAGLGAYLRVAGGGGLTVDGVFRISGSLRLGTSVVVAAAVSGFQVKKFPVYNATGTLLGYVPIYDA